MVLLSVFLFSRGGCTDSISCSFPSLRMYNPHKSAQQLLFSFVKNMIRWSSFSLSSDTAAYLLTWVKKTELTCACSFQRAFFPCENPVFPPLETSYVYEKILQKRDKKLCGRYRVILLLHFSELLAWLWALKACGDRSSFAALCVPFFFAGSYGTGRRAFWSGLWRSASFGSL